MTNIIWLWIQQKIGYSHKKAKDLAFNGTLLTMVWHLLEEGNKVRGYCSSDGKNWALLQALRLA